ncbi:MAG: CvpA family protein [Phycisphaerales bacterium]|nr:MAG: CvpA family protein [Phycisphaerales bacterium]
MASLAVVLIILGCAAIQYFKGTVVRAFATIIVTICAGMVAFGFFEVLANVFISRGDNSRYMSLVPWAQTLSFLLLFVLTFAILQTGVTFLTRHPVDLGLLPERIGRVVCGLIAGLLASGLLLTAFEMAPLSLSYPYPRFDPARLDVERPQGVLLNANGFATGLFSFLSNGSFSGKRSFAALHPDYLDQLFLNRVLGIDKGGAVSSTAPAIEVPRPAVWPASQAIAEQVDAFVGELRTRGGKIAYDQAGSSVSLPVSPDSGYLPTIVRVGVKKRAIKRDAAVNGGAFTPSQLRVICKRKGYGDDPLAGGGINVYPLGYLKSADQMQVSPLISVGTDDFEGSPGAKYIDFVFCVPNGFEPVLVQLKLNSVVEIPPGGIVSADQAPAPAVFSPSAGRRRDRKSSPSPSPPPSPPAQQQEAGAEQSGLSDLSRSVTGVDLDE